MPVRKQHIHIPVMPPTQIGNRKASSRTKHIPTSLPPTGAASKLYVLFHVLSRVPPVAGSVCQVNHRRRRPNLTRPNRNHGSLPSVPRPRRLIRLPSPRTHPQPAGTSTDPGASAVYSVAEIPILIDITSHFRIVFVVLLQRSQQFPSMIGRTLPRVGIPPHIHVADQMPPRHIPNMIRWHFRPIAMGLAPSLHMRRMIILMIGNIQRPGNSYLPLVVHALNAPSRLLCLA